MGEVRVWLREFSGLCTEPQISTGIWFCLMLIVVCFITSELTSNYSQVDRIWSLSPVAFAACFRNGTDHLRGICMMALILFWGSRLTYNFYRRGGYKLSYEDYRWDRLREIIPNKWMFSVFNLIFISSFQNVLLLLITAPVYIGSRTGAAPLNIVDAVALLLAIGCLIMETAADGQQRRFQTDKYAKMKRGEKLDGDYARGFLTSGLFRFSRHPNFAGEMGFWWAIYLFSVAASGTWLNPSIAGAAFLTLLFQGSTALTEGITASKYPAYRQYKQTTSRLLPLPPRSKVV